MLTNNEKKVLKLLMVSINIDYSINNIAKECHLSPNGALKILRKLEKEDILKTKRIANIISYKLNFDNENTLSILHLALVSKIEDKIKYRKDDFKDLKEITDACIIFGSYITKKKAPNDLDVLFLLNKDKFKVYKKKLNDIKNIVPAKIHDVLQTENDLEDNICSQDKVILDILKEGILLWGHDKIIKVIKNVHKR